MAVGMLRSQERHPPPPSVPHGRGLLHGLYRSRIIYSINKQDYKKPGSRQKQEFCTSVEADILSIFTRGETCIEGRIWSPSAVPGRPSAMSISIDTSTRECRSGWSKASIAVDVGGGCYCVGDALGFWAAPRRVVVGWLGMPLWIGGL